MTSQIGAAEGFLADGDHALAVDIHGQHLVLVITCARLHQAAGTVEDLDARRIPERGHELPAIGAPGDGSQIWRERDRSATVPASQTQA